MAQEVERRLSVGVLCKNIEKENYALKVTNS